MIPSRNSERRASTVGKGVCIFIPICFAYLSVSHAENTLTVAKSAPGKACYQSCLSKGVCGTSSEEACCTRFCELDGLWQARLNESDPERRNRGLCELITSYRTAVFAHSERHLFTPPTLSIKIGILKAALGFPDEADRDLNAATSVINGDRPEDRALRERLKYSEKAIIQSLRLSLSRLVTEITQARQRGKPTELGSRQYCAVVLATKAGGTATAVASTAVPRPTEEKPARLQTPEKSPDASPTTSPGGRESQPPVASPAPRSVKTEGPNQQVVGTSLSTSPAPSSSPTASAITAPARPPAVPALTASGRPPAGPAAAEPAKTAKPLPAAALATSSQPTTTKSARCGTGCGIGLGIGGAIVGAATLVGLIFAGKAIELSRAPTLPPASSPDSATLFGAAADNVR